MEKPKTMETSAGPTREEVRKVVDETVRRLTDEGRIIEGGWLALKALSIPPDVSDEQLNDMRHSYFAGAQHLWASILSFLEDGTEATEKDLHRMTLVAVELNEWAETYKALVTKAETERAQRGH
jgi:hypothetical protein